MTNANDTLSPAPTPPLSEADPRFAFARAVATGGEAIAAVRSDQLTSPTPCTDFDVRQLLEHLVMVLERVAAIGRGDDAFAPQPTDGAANQMDRSWIERWQEAAHQVQAAWTDDAVLTRTVVLPWATMSGAETLATYVNEIVVHTWDLAQATGQEPAWDARAVEVAFAAIHRALPEPARAESFEAIRQTMPPEQRDFDPPFADAVPVGDSAPLIDRLVAWNGRRPA